MGGRISTALSLEDVRGEAALLRLRFRDLPLNIHSKRARSTELDRALAQVHRELERRGIRFRPHYWLSSEWFTPDGVPGVAVPFYLCHPRLRRLEKHQMRGMELESTQACIQILRHEIGHAIENAFKLRRLEKVRRVFGRSEMPYPRKYAPKPYSRKYVRNLPGAYAQSHPDEDFAETFAVWLTNRRTWKKRYRGWAALQKLEAMDELMRDFVVGREPLLVNRREIDPLPKLNTTLRQHYERQRQRYGLSGSADFDRSLKRLFKCHHAPRVDMTAHTFLRKMKDKLSREVAVQTGEPLYRVNRVVSSMIRRAKELDLRIDTRKPITARAYRSIQPLLRAHVCRFLRAGLHRIAI